jgi:hypothetical protein
MALSMRSVRQDGGLRQKVLRGGELVAGNVKVKRFAGKYTA